MEGKYALNIDIGKGAVLTSEEGTVNLKTTSGAADRIVTKALIDNGDINPNAIATSRQANGGEGILTKADVNSGGLAIVPNADADIVMTLNSYVNINRKGSSKSQIKTNGTESNDGRGGDINVTVSSEGLNVKADGHSNAAGAGGGSDAEADIKANLQNTIWVDKANLMAEGNVNLRANSRGNGDKPLIHARSHAELYGAGGKVDSDAYLSGASFNQIKSNNTRNVRVTGRAFTHKAVDPYRDIAQRLENPKDYLPPPTIKHPWRRHAQRLEGCRQVPLRLLRGWQDLHDERDGPRR